MSRPLPFNCPRGLSRIEAARYIGVSPSTFDRLVAEGVMPKPKELGARRVYDRAQLDSAFDALGDGELDTDGPNEWD
jgi:excisionase family DNA binding protein